MGDLIFNGGKKSIRRLSKVQNSIDRFVNSHPGRLSKRNHSKLGRLLKKRAKALSKATGMKIHSICD